MPIWLLVDLPMFGSSGFFVEQGGDFCGGVNGLRLRQRQLTFVLTDGGLVYFEFEQVTMAIADIIGAITNAFAPCVKIEFAAQFYIGSTQSYAFAEDARKIRLPA